jgi:streptogramin lyase
MRSSVLTRALRLLLIVLCTLPVLAANPTTRVSQYGHTVWRVQDGILNAAPYVIVQSKDGYLWIGTETGLLRFDGVRFVQFDPPGWEQLIDPQIYQLFPASDGTLWISTRAQLASWRNGILTVVPSPPGIGFINQFAEDSEGRVWFAATRRADHRSLCEVDKIAVKCFGQAEGLPLVYGTHLVSNPDGSLTVSSSDTVARWDPRHGLVSSYTFPKLVAFAGLRGISALRGQADGGALVGVGFAGPGLGLQRLKDGLVTPYTVSTLEGSTLVP